MSKIIILIATTVVAINLVYTILPSGNYEKYCKYIFGLILILIFAGTLLEFDISSNVLDFNNNVPVFENQKIVDTIHSSTELLICENIQNMLKVNKIKSENVSVVLEQDQLISVRVKLENKDDEKTASSLISSYCDIDENKIVIE